MNLIGTRIGSYVVERELGSGGAGTVYACRHTLIDREVAVKVLHDEHVRDPDQVARFFQEAKAAADIGHPNIIVIIDYGTLEVSGSERTYVMMESLEGESLDKRLRRGGLSGDDIIHIFSQIASALVACHGKGIIHRDLKPSNIYLCRRSFDPLFVKVLDFGTAKLTAPAPGMRRTQYGVVIGTPAYMSPEQCEGKGAIDHRTDVYSLGAMLYEMLTGSLPFEGSIGEILMAHMTRTPDPPRQRNPAIPPEWEALCLRMMEKAREARFQSVTELARALEDLRGHAAAYEAARVQRAESGHSGHTLVSGGRNDVRETLRVDLGAATQAATTSAPATSAFGAATQATTSAPATSAFGAATQATTSAPATSAFGAATQAATSAPATSAFGVATAPAATSAPATSAFGVATEPAATSAPATSAFGVATAPAATAPATSAFGAASAPATSAFGAATPATTAPATAEFSYTSFNPRSACAALVEDPRHAAFGRTLMARPAGRWFEVGELCQTAGVAQPATLPLDLGLFASWLDHPYPDPSLAAVVFLSLRTGWSAVVLCARMR